MTKRAVPSSRDHLDDSRPRSGTSKRRQCRACGGFHLYKRCYYLFPTLAPEASVPRPEIKKVVKEALDEDEVFAEEIRKLQKAVFSTKISYPLKNSGFGFNDSCFQRNYLIPEFL